MKSYRIALAAGICAAALGLSTAPAQAQAEAVGTAIAAPIVVRTIDALKPKPKPPGSEWLKARVIHADAQSITVREQDNGMIIHTFTLTPPLKDQMQAKVDKGGYQYGDKVKILHQHGQTVALKISGKPSKPI
jgi:hypothetical protein